MDRFQQLVEVRALQRRNRHLQRLARHALDHDLVLQKLGAHAVGVCLRLVDLVDGNDDRNACGLGVIDGFDRLRHDAIVRRHDEDDDVRHLRAARAHGRECLVARRVDEGDAVAQRRRHLVGADVLRDATRLARDDVCLPDGVEERRLAVVDVAHDGDDRGAGHEHALVVLLADEPGLDVGFGDALGRMPELLNDELRRIGVDHIVDLVHLAFFHQVLDDVDGALGHAVGELLDGDDLGDHHLAHDLLARLRNAHRLELLALAPALERGKRTLTLLLVEGVVDRELYALALFVDLRCRSASAGLTLLDAAAALVLLGRLHGTAGALGSFALRLEAGGTGNIDLARLAAFARLQRRIEGGAWLRSRCAICPRTRRTALGARSRCWTSLGRSGRRTRRFGRRATAGGAFLARSASSSRSKSSRTLAAASARARASRSSVDNPRAAAAGLTFCGAAVSGRIGGFFCATSGSSVASIGGASVSEPSFLVLRFSTTTDFERPWLKFCRTWPDSTVRWSDSGLRTPPRRVLSVVSFVSVMLFP